MKQKNRTVHVLLIRGADFPNISFKIRFSTLRVLAVLSVLFTAALVFFVIYYGKIAVRFAEVSALTRENQALKEKMLKVEELSLEIDKIKDYEKKIRVIAKNYSTAVPDTQGIQGQVNIFNRKYHSP